MRRSIGAAVELVGHEPSSNLALGDIWTVLRKMTAKAWKEEERILSQPYKGVWRQVQVCQLPFYEGPQGTQTAAAHRFCSLMGPLS